MPALLVPSGRGYVEIPLAPSERKTLRAVQVHQADDALNVDLEFEDDSTLEMVFRLEFRASAKLLDYNNGNYKLRRTIKPARKPAQT